MFIRRVTLWCAAAAGMLVLTNCSHAVLSSVPHVVSATPTASPAAGALNASQVNAALQGVGSSYATLPHTDPAADLRALASSMTASGQFQSAVVSPGGITATLTDGSLAVIFGDSPEDTVANASSILKSVGRRAMPSRATGRANTITPGVIGPATSNEIAFLVDTDDDATFVPSLELGNAQAFANAGFSAAGYGVDVVSISLENIVSLGTGHPIDFLSIGTHGILVGSAKPYTFMLKSTTPVNAATKLAFAGDLAAHRVAYAYYLSTKPNNGVVSGEYAFTAAFLTKYLHFNPGAVVYDNACFGANPDTVSDVTTALKAAGVGQYFGWTKATVNVDSYESTSFFLDRILGETKPSATGLDQYTPQRTPPQRPFPLTDAYAVMQGENRSGPFFAGQNLSYVTSNQGAPLQDINLGVDPVADGYASFLQSFDLGGSVLAAGPIVYALPSIAKMRITAEGAMSGTLELAGSFPAAAGTVQITDGTSVVPLSVVSWSSNDIVVTIPAPGTGSKGLVQVLSAAGIASNQVPLTQWQATVTYVESDTLSNLNGTSGQGSGGFTAVFSFAFRSDVHPTVPAIDATPQPQNLTFPQVEGGSTATITTLNGKFVATQGTPPPATASFGLSSMPAMAPGPLPLAAGTFIAGAFTGQPSPCNNGSAGFEGDQGNVFCPAFGLHDTSVGMCSPDADDLALCDPTYSPTASFGAPSLNDPALVMLTMDPASYAITVAAPTTSFTRLFESSLWPAHASISGSVGAPDTAPTSASPASRTRRADDVRVHRAR